MSAVLRQLVDESSTAVCKLRSKAHERLPDICGLKVPLAETIPQPSWEDSTSLHLGQRPVQLNVDTGISFANWNTTSQQDLPTP